MSTITSRLINWLEAYDTGGSAVVIGKQGDISTRPDEPLSTTLGSGGGALVKQGTLASGTAARTIFDTTTDVPATFLIMHYWCEVASWIQFIGDSSNVIFQVAAKHPFSLSTDEIVIAANTTAISDDTEPTDENIDKIIINQYSGGNGEYKAIFLL